MPRIAAIAIPALAPPVKPELVGIGIGAGKGMELGSVGAELGFPEMAGLAPGGFFLHTC